MRAPQLRFMPHLRRHLLFGAMAVPGHALPRAGQDLGCALADSRVLALKHGRHAVQALHEGIQQSMA